jgi:hypothetical protein
MSDNWQDLYGTTLPLTFYAYASQDLDNPSWYEVYVVAPGLEQVGIVQLTSDDGWVVQDPGQAKFGACPGDQVESGAEPAFVPTEVYQELATCVHI